MRWDWLNRRVQLSVGELARFALLAGAEEAGGRWRAELGSHWHAVLRGRAAGEPGWEFERPVSGTLQQGGWEFALQGRVDQLRPGSTPPLLREIKTVDRRLPADAAELRAAYPQHFHQALLYGYLLARQGLYPDTELVFLEIETGLTQTVRLDEADLVALRAHLETVVALLEERREHFRRLRAWEVPAPFAQWRPGQETARADLEAAIAPGGVVLFEAPTGFGKTGLVLEQALRRLAGGEVERVLLLTGKNTGHTPLLRQLGAFRAGGSALTAHALRSRKDHALDAAREDGLSLSEIAERWRASGLSAPRLLAAGLLDLEEVRALGASHGIPPWAITRLLLPHADVWVADFNYLFDPVAAQVPPAIPTFDPARTLLVVDEAHNLPERAAACRSHQLEARAIDAVLAEVQFARFPGPLARRLDCLLALVKQLAPCECLDPVAEADLIGLLRETVAALRASGFGADELSQDSRDWLWELPWLLADWDQPGLPYQVSCPARGCVRLDCLDASSAIAPVLRAFHAAVLMSATLRPWDDFTAALGLSEAGGGPAVRTVTGRADWLEGCFEVLVDARADTRFRQRDQHLGLTAATIGQTALHAKGCTVAFFPSYRYAERVLERLRFLHPALRCELQPRDKPLEEQLAFLEAALALDDVLLLVLGGRFSEGIDALGGRVRQAIVVGPALPEVNALQKAREQAAPGGRAAAFRAVYLIPGLRKVSQALGRLVREPGQRARVLLHDKRFVEPAFQDLLPEYLRPAGCIVTDSDFADRWLQPLRR